MHSRGGIACIHASLLKWTMKVNNFSLWCCALISIRRQCLVNGKFAVKLSKIRRIIIGGLCARKFVFRMYAIGNTGISDKVRLDHFQCRSELRY